MTQEDEKKFEEWWEKEFGTWKFIGLEKGFAELAFLASRRILRENQNKSLDFLNDKKEDIYTEADGTKLGEKE